MTPQKRFSIIISLIFLLLALSLLVLVCLPFPVFKALVDNLVVDGEFGALHSDNAGVFRVVLASFALAFLACAYLTWFHRWRDIWTFLKHLWVDFLDRLHAVIPGKKEIPWLGAVVIILVIGIIYRMEYLFSSLHHDEAYTYMAFAHSLVTAVTDYHLPNNHVFHSILVFLSTRIFGNAPWAVRLPAFAAGVLIIPALYSLGKRHYNRLVGLCAGLLVAISPALVGYSDNARGYTLVALFGVLLLNLGYQVRELKNRYTWFLIVLVSALGMYTVPAFLFPFGILYAWLFLEGIAVARPGYSSKIDFLRYWLISGFCAFLLTLVFYLPILVVSGPDAFFTNQFVAPIAWSGFLETLVQRLKETWLEWTFRVPMWIITLGILGLALSLALHKKISSIRIPLQLASFVWILMVFIIQRPNAWSKVWVFLLPLIILWSAAGLLGGAGLVGKGRIPLLLFIPMLALAGYRAGVLVPQLPGLWNIKDDEERAVLFVKENMDVEAGMVVSPPDDAPVWYYAERHGMSSMLAEQEDSSRWFVLVNPGEGQTPESVMDDRGPDGIDSISCIQLDDFGKIIVYQCRERP